MILKETLRQIPLFSGLTDQEVETFSKLVNLTKVPKGGIIFNYGEYPADLHLLFEGQLKSVRYTDEGKEAVLHIIHAGEVFAVTPTYLNTAYTGTAIAVKKSQIGKITRNDFLTLLKQNPEFALKVMGILAQRTNKLLTRIEDQTVHSPLERVVRYLIRESHRYQSPDFTLRVNKTDLAKTLGTTPETLSRCFGELCSEQALQVVGKKICILDEIKLLRLGHSNCVEKSCWSKRCNPCSKAVP